MEVQSVNIPLRNDSTKDNFNENYETSNSPYGDTLQAKESSIKEDLSNEQSTSSSLVLKDEKSLDNSSENQLSDSIISKFDSEDRLIAKESPTKEDEQDNEQEITSNIELVEKKSLENLNENQPCESGASKFDLEEVIVEEPICTKIDEQVTISNHSLHEKKSLDEIKQSWVNIPKETISVPIITDDTENQSQDKAEKKISQEDLLTPVPEETAPLEVATRQAMMPGLHQGTTTVIADPSKYSSRDTASIPANSRRSTVIRKQADLDYLCHLADELWCFNHDIQYADLETRRMYFKRVFLYVTGLLGIMEFFLLIMYFAMGGMRKWKIENSVWLAFLEIFLWALFIFGTSHDGIRRIRVANIVFLVLVVQFSIFFLGCKAFLPNSVSTVISLFNLALACGCLHLLHNHITFYASDTKMYLVLGGIGGCFFVLILLTTLLFRLDGRTFFLAFLKSYNMLLMLSLASYQLFNGRMRLLTTDEDLWGATQLFVALIFVLSVICFVSDSSFLIDTV